MLPRADLLVNPVGHAEPLVGLEAVGDARQQAFQRSLAGLLGQSLQAEVLSKLTDGSFLVKVAGASARMLLPPGAQVGSEIPLTLVAIEPRPTFEVATSHGGQPALATSEAGPALLPGPAGSAARAEPLVYLDGVAPAAGGGAAPAGAAASALAQPVEIVAEAPAPAPAAAPASPGAAASAVSLPATISPGAALPVAGATAPLQGSALPASAVPGAAPPAGEPPAAAPASTPVQRAQAYAAALLGKAPLVPADQLPAIDPGSTSASLSETARVITSVLTTALKSEHTPSAIVARAPLLASPPAGPEKLAAALRESIASSGLFYESHVAEWAGGKRALGDLVREPQMQRALNTAAPEAAARQHSPASDPATAQFINLQLATHEQAHVAWQGQAWPGQPLHWEISKDAPEGHAGAGDDAPVPTWRSAVKLRFALLGEVRASVVLVGEQLHIQVDAGDADVGALLRARADTLAEAMAAAGTPLASLQIRGAGERGDG
ncbi:MAG: flagellar hook-length control protein FliK [Pseudomonadota bacterium]